MRSNKRAAWSIRSGMNRPRVATRCRTIILMITTRLQITGEILFFLPIFSTQYRSKAESGYSPGFNATCGDLWDLYTRFKRNPDKSPVRRFERGSGSRSKGIRKGNASNATHAHPRTIMVGRLADQRRRGLCPAIRRVVQVPLKTCPTNTPAVVAKQVLKQATGGQRVISKYGRGGGVEKPSKEPPPRVRCIVLHHRRLQP